MVFNSYMEGYDKEMGNLELWDKHLNMHLEIISYAELMHKYANPRDAKKYVRLLEKIQQWADRVSEVDMENSSLTLNVCLSIRASIRDCT